VNDIPVRNLSGSRWILSRLWAGLLIAIIPFTWCKPASAQDVRKVKFSVQPAYPELAKKNKIQGVTRLQVVIAPDGAIKDIKVLGGNPVLVQASVEAVKKWKYEPGSAESTSVLKFEFKPDQ
jgi:TonB family protein